MEDISLHLLDLVQNSIAAGASLVKIFIRESPKEGRLWVSVRDNGRGMDENEAAKAADPFYTTRITRKVGLGIPLFKASAEATDGSFEIRSKKGEGTEIAAMFHTSHIDCLPLGKIEDSIAALIFMNPEMDIEYIHECCSNRFKLDTREIKKVLGDVSISLPEVVDWIKEYVRNGLDELNGGVGNEIS
ncbi:MAG TPA: ATP-binding protein [Clostridiales bacterium]|nr:ATP-binding protein [Clostridiales bacterium]